MPSKTSHFGDGSSSQCILPLAGIATHCSLFVDTRGGVRNNRTAADGTWQLPTGLGMARPYYSDWLRLHKVGQYSLKRNVGAARKRHSQRATRAPRRRDQRNSVTSQLVRKANPEADIGRAPQATLKIANELA